GVWKVEGKRWGAALVAGFASPAGVEEAIDFSNIGFTASTKVSFTQQPGQVGTLTVTNGTQVANLTLLGTYTTGSFQIANDGFGGTLVTDPPAVVGSSSNPVLAHA